MARTAASEPNPPAPPPIRWTCGACGRTDDGNSNQVDLGDGRAMFFHPPGSSDCGVKDADPRPDLAEDASASQLRVALLAGGFDIPEDRVLNVVSVDCSDPANHNQPVEA